MVPMSLWRMVLPLIERHHLECLHRIPPSATTRLNKIARRHVGRASKPHPPLWFCFEADQVIELNDGSISVVGTRLAFTKARNNILKTMKRELYLDFNMGTYGAGCHSV